MDQEKCSECKNGLVFGEKNQCIYCELTRTTGNKSCPKCSTSVLRDKGSLYCELCKCFYHNSCNEFPLDDEYCTLLYEVPRNIKWFCDKCIWDTEKWISDYSVNESCDSRTDAIDNANFDDVKDILDQEKYAKSNKKIIKQNPKHKKGKPKSGSKKSKNSNYSLKTKTTEIKALCNAKNSPIKEDIEKDNVSIIEKEDTNYDSTLEAEDVDYHPSESDSDLDDKGQKKNLGKDEVKKKYPKKELSEEFQCDQCPKIFCKKRSLEEHKMKHSGEYPHICNFCGKGMARPDILKSHIKNIHTKEKPFTCPDCDFCSRTKLQLKKHIRLSHKKEIIEKFQCDQCPKTFCAKRRLDEHKMKHSGEYPYNCNFCGKGKARPDLLKSHIKKIHTEEKPFNCPDCDFSSRTMQKLKTHIRRSHTVLETVNCSLCDYQTTIKQHLKKHIKSHTGELDIKYFMCEECGINLKSFDSLKIHQRRHSGEKPFNCKVCEKSFRSRSNLRVHMFVHTQDKNAFCLMCGKGFPTKDQLNNHLKTVHTDEKPFACDICGNKYKTKHNLKNHKSGKRGSCHPMNSQKQKIESQQKFKSSSESNLSDSNDSHLAPLTQPYQQPPLLFYAGGNEKSVAPVYSSSHITATLHCPPQYLSVINYMDH